MQTTTEGTKARNVNVTDIKKFLNYGSTQAFMEDWKKLSDADKNDLLDSLDNLHAAGKYVKG